MNTDPFRYAKVVVWTGRIPDNTGDVHCGIRGYWETLCAGSYLHCNRFSDQWCNDHPGEVLRLIPFFNSHDPDGNSYG